MDPRMNAERIEALRQHAQTYGNAPLHPRAGEHWEQDRCPDCGAVGIELDPTSPSGLIPMACPVCDA